MPNGRLLICRLFFTTIVLPISETASDISRADYGSNEQKEAPQRHVVRRFRQLDPLSTTNIPLATVENPETNPWLSVQLAARSYVSSVLVYGRSDCCRQYLAVYEIWVGDAAGEPQSAGLTRLALNYKSFAVVDGGNCILGGCTDSFSVGYNALATFDDGSCPVIVFGCTDSRSLLYVPSATNDDGSCTFLGCMSSNAFNFNPTATVSSVCSPRVVGCQDPTADNYFSSANVAGYCDYPGCTDSSALNFDAEANRDTGLCEYSRLGCTISYALNYAIDANTDDGTCFVLGCADSNDPNYQPLSTFDFGCVGSRRRLYQSSIRRQLQIAGCVAPSALNYNPSATVYDGSCVWTVKGCTNPSADNYNPAATEEYSPSTCTISGCLDPNAYNYDSNANAEASGTCTHQYFACTNSLAVNYISGANTDDGTCDFPVLGCISEKTLEYNSLATAQPESLACTVIVTGCMDSFALNYQRAANVDSGGVVTTSCVPSITLFTSITYTASTLAATAYTASTLAASTFAAALTTSALDSATITAATVAATSIASSTFATATIAA
ncbi:hypothetical protein AB1Y20_012991 [Prymnesium parvum]|uniref:Uncharacterized protein n=1 Tax=Prymnesium parvum TaxID=97485 RepID=A0AB34IMC2_PRYPA